MLEVLSTIWIIIKILLGILGIVILSGIIIAVVRAIFEELF